MTSRFQAPRLSGSYMVLELTNRCNLSCVHCAVSEEGHPHHLQTGVMSTQSIVRLFTDMKETGAHFDTLILFWLGEPLLHPQFVEIYQTALRFSVQHDLFENIEVHSNAALLTKPIVDALLNSAKISQRLHITIDAATPETYEKIKGRDRLDLVERNAKAFILAKHQKGAQWPRPIMQFILGENNAFEAAAFRDKWIEAFKETHQSLKVVAGNVPNGSDPILFFRLLDCPTAELQAKNNRLFLETMKRMGIETKAPQPPQQCQPKACSGFWKSPVINWNGDLTACTRDNALENRIGNIAKTSFSALWWGDKMNKRRQDVAQANYKQLRICQNCFIPTSLNHTDISLGEINRHRQQIGGSR